MIRKGILIFFLGCIAGTAASQNLHFSQFNLLPVTLNPALTGGMKADWRVAGIHRQQWKSVTSLFESTALSGEYSFKHVLKPENNLGIGVVFIDDKQGEGVIEELHAGVVAAYHYTFGAANRGQFSFGLQGIYRQTSIDYTGLQFGNQYEFFLFNPDLDSGEPQGNDQWSNVNFNAGVSLRYLISQRFELNGGFAAFNLLKPNNAVYDVAENSIIRSVFHTFGSYQLSELMMLYPALQVMVQGGTYNAILGTQVGYKLSKFKGVEVLGGIAYRYKDAMIFSGGVVWQKLKLTAAYDLTTSQLKETKEAVELSRGGVRAFEIGLVWLGWSRQSATKPVSIPCKLF